MNTGPLTNAFDEDNEGVVLKEFIVYRVKDDKRIIYTIYKKTYITNVYILF